MGGGLMQLVAYGAQDIYLTSNPQITFFKVVYRRHTNFSREVIKQTFDGTPSAGSFMNVTISRNGDLVHKVYLETPAKKLDTGRLAHNPGHSLIDYVELEIGGQQIDKIYGHWMEVWARLTQKNETSVVGFLDAAGHDSFVQVSGLPSSVTVAYNEKAQNIPQDKPDNSSHVTVHRPSTRYQKLAGGGGITSHHPDNTGVAQITTRDIPELSIPLPFWFCKNPGLSLPLIALQYHEVKLKLKFSNRISSGGGFYFNSGDDLNIWAEYIYLDTPERRRFAQGTHEYLIEQVQRNTGISTRPGNGSYCNATIDLNFNHPVKELIFAADFYNKTDWYGVLPGIANYKTNLTLKLNGHDRFSANRRWQYFSKTQIFEHHTGPGNLYGGLEGVMSKERNDNNASGSDVVDFGKLDQIGVYSFALKPEEHQPSGTCNFSRIDSTRLIINDLYSGVNGDAIELVVYAINYNVLRIMSGMGGLAYSN
uniref:Major capsid protein N-terminal domain-containing protein n=1 Tax=viral metagenome TaxID=1070528 RepID=A0A6C0CYI9_9ZZZZ